MVKADISISAMSQSDTSWLNHACNLAERGLGRTWPNPSVGCVIVKNGRVVGRGTTGDGGRPHAEVQALRNAGILATDAHVYVTLEPCAHHGKTPPCADALIDAGVGRVIAGSLDPDPRVNGTGLSRLKEAGIATFLIRDHQRSIDLNAGFFSRIRRERPYLTLKLASTLDGKISMASGQSRWITQAEARRHTHMLRSRHDGIMVGRGTIDADDPMLDVREMGPCPAPVRIVVDTNASISPDKRLLTTAQECLTWILCGHDAPPYVIGNLEEQGAEVLLCDMDDGRVDLHAAMMALGRRGMTRVLCEGGSTLAAGLLIADLVDELVVYHAGKVIGADGLSSVGALPITDLNDVPQFDLAGLDRVGCDMVSRWRRRR